MNEIEHTPTPVSRDWEPIDIRYALEKLGWSLRRLSTASGYQFNAVSQALRDPWPQVEWIVAEALGKKPWELWPSRYPNGPEPRPQRGEKPRRTHQYKSRNIGKTHLNVGDAA